MTLQNANGGHHPEWDPPLAHTEASSYRSPRGGAKAVLTPQGCKAARRSSARRQGTLAAPGAAAARRLPQHGVSSPTRIRTEPMEVPTTSTPNGHHLPLIPKAGPRGPAPNGRTSAPFPCQLSDSDRQRFTPTPTGQQTERPGHPPYPSQGRLPASYRGDSTPGTHYRGNPRTTNGLHKGREDNPPNTPPPQVGCDDTGPEGGQRPRDQLGLYTTGFPSPAATRPNRRGSEDAPQHREHDASGPRADAEMTESSGPQESGDALPTAPACSMPQQREPSTGNVPRGHPGTTPGHPSLTGATPDQDREAMPPPPPPPPQRRNTGPFYDAELRTLYGIHATAPSSELVPALREHLQNVEPSRLFAVVPLPQAATTEVFVRQHQALVTPGTQITDDLVDAWISWFNTHHTDQGGIRVPHLGWAHMLIAPPTNPRPAPSAGGRERAAPPPRAETLRIPPYEGLAEWDSGTARDRGRNLTSMVERYPETARAAPPPRERDPSTIAMIVLESGEYHQVRVNPHPQESHWSMEAADSMLPANTPLPAGHPYPPAQRPAPGPPDGHRVGDSRHLAPGPCPLLPLAVGAAPLPAHQGLNGEVAIPAGRLAAAGGHPPARANGGDPHSHQPVHPLRDPPDPGAGDGRPTAACHPH